MIAEEEIVHAIVVNGAQKRITVVFRGSVTQKDFLQDAKCAQKKIDNPVASLVERRELMIEGIRIHTGFHEYLFRKNPETEKTRLEEIIAEVVESLQNYPGYDFYCSGHSLGGALCTLFGFFAAANDEIISLLEGPVRVYSFASPYVGNWKFKMAFQELERKKRLQHLRIANLEDMVTLLPFATPKLTALSPALSLIKGAGNLYKHTGIQLQMTSEPRKEGSDAIYSISYPKEHEADDEQYAAEVQDSLDAGKSLAQAFYYLIRKEFDRVVLYHSCEEYEERLQKCKSALGEVTLDELYVDKSIVGVILDEDYEPKKRDSGMQKAKRAYGYLKGSNKSKYIESK
jgi:predicted lipase